MLALPSFNPGPSFLSDTFVLRLCTVISGSDLILLRVALHSSDLPLHVRSHPHHCGTMRFVNSELTDLAYRPCSATAQSKPSGPLSNRVDQGARTSCQGVHCATSFTNRGGMCNSPCQASSRTLRARWKSGGELFDIVLNVHLY
jgi:hypothetical protein